MNTSGSVKMLVIAATAALSVGAVAVPKTFVVSAPGAAITKVEAVDAIDTIDHGRRTPALAFVRPFSPGPHSCVAQIGGKLDGRSISVRSPACAFLADL